MTTRVLPIARYTVLEAVRTRLPLAIGIAMLGLVGMSVFVRELALIQDARIQTIAYAAVARVSALFIIALHVGGTLSREFEDKGLDAVLALDIPRWQYIAGKYAGYAALGIGIAAVTALPVFFLSDVGAALAWLISLALESCIIVAIAMFCVVTFSHLPSAMAFVAGFYLLCRSIAGLRMLAEHPTAGADTLAHQLMGGVLTVVSTLVPALDAWTRTTWLVDAPPSWTELSYIAGETGLYVVLLVTATLIDFHRKSL